MLFLRLTICFLFSASFAVAAEKTTPLPEKVTAKAESEIAVKIGDDVTAGLPPEIASAVNASDAEVAGKVKKVIDETEIPVQLEPTKKVKEAEASGSKAILSLGILAILAAGALYWIKKNGRSLKKSENTQIKVLTQHYLGPKKSLAIIRVAGESILVGITDQNINLIKSLSLLDEDIPEETPAPNNFSQVMNIKNMMAPADEDFSMAKIKDVVSDKLRNMKVLE